MGNELIDGQGICFVWQRCYFVFRNMIATDLVVRGLVKRQIDETGY